MGRGRTRNRGNSLRRASLACWTEMGRGRTRNRGNSLRKASPGGSNTASMLDGHETVQIACGKLHREGAIRHAGRTRNRANSLQRASLACWTEMGRGRTRNRGNSLRRASLACWTEMGRGRTRNRGNSLRKASPGGSNTASMLDGHETVQIACGKLHREGAIQHAGRTRNRANSLRKASLGGSDTWRAGGGYKYLVRIVNLVS